MLEIIAGSLLENDPENVLALVKEALDKGYEAKEIITEGLVKGMNVVGEKFAEEEIFIPEVLIAAMGMDEAMKVLKPLLTEGSIPSKGTVVIGTVAGDIHEIGKNLVAIMLEGAGYKVINLGVDVSAEEFLKAVQNNNATVVACSSMLTTTMNEIFKVIDILKEYKLRDKVKLVVGGAPITESWAERIGADGYGYDASGAVALLNSFAGAN